MASNPVRSDSRSPWGGLECNPRSAEPWRARPSGWLLVGQTARRTPRQAEPKGPATPYGGADTRMGRCASLPDRRMADSQIRSDSGSTRGDVERDPSSLAAGQPRPSRWLLDCKTSCPPSWREEDRKPAIAHGESDPGLG